MSARLRMALETGGLQMPEAGIISVLRPPIEADLSLLPADRVRIVQPFKPDHDHFRQLGFECVDESEDHSAASLVFLPRSKVLARKLISQANRCSDELIIVDGSKSDGVDSLLKEVQKRAELAGKLAKAHGKIFWFSPRNQAFDDWNAPEFQIVEGFVTAPGIFSADGVDPASALLASVLPQKTGAHVVDLGAGWGLLSAKLLENPGIETLDMVEADHVALNCARRNVTDPRAEFHWADAVNWKPETRVDTVVMNPPFHTGRKADPDLGRAFIASAARMLKPSGSLWMVANRHLPYENSLRDHFSIVVEVSGNPRFKVMHAMRPKRATPTRTRR